MPKREKTTSSEKEIAEMFRALGDPTRLRIFRFLLQRCHPITVEHGEKQWMAIGPTVGEVCAAVSDSKKITAKVSHHLKEMRLAGVIEINRQGKNMICGISQKAIDQMTLVLSNDGSATLDSDATDISVVPDIHFLELFPSEPDTNSRHEEVT